MNIPKLMVFNEQNKKAFESLGFAAEIRSGEDFQFAEGVAAYMQGLTHSAATYLIESADIMQAIEFELHKSDRPKVHAIFHINQTTGYSDHVLFQDGKFVNKPTINGNARMFLGEKYEVCVFSSHSDGQYHGHSNVSVEIWEKAQREDLLFA